MYLKLMALCLISVVFSTLLKGQEIILAVDTNQALIGERIQLMLAVKADKNTSIDWPIIQDNWQGLEVLAKSAKDTLTENNNFIYRQAISLTAFDTGVYKIDSVALVFHRLNLTDSIYAYPLYLAYRTVQLDSTNRYYDIKQPMDIDYSYWFEILMAILVIALIALVFVWWYKTRKTSEQTPEKKVVIPAHITALKQLKVLQETEAWMHLPLKTYYIKLSTILRRYLQDQLDILAVETITDEIIEAVRTKSFDEQLKNELQDLLQMSDLVKFAKVKPVLEEGEKYINIALKFVDQTKPSDTKSAANDE